MATSCWKKISSSSGSLRLRNGCSSLPLTSTGSPRNSLRTVTESISVTGLSARTTRTTDCEAGRAGPAARHRIRTIASMRRTGGSGKRCTPLDADIVEVALKGVRAGKLQGQCLARHEVPAQANDVALAHHHWKELQVRVVAGIVGDLPTQEARQVMRQTPFGFHVADPEAASDGFNRRAQLRIRVVPGREHAPVATGVDAKCPQQLQVGVIESGDRRLRQPDGRQLIRGHDEPEAGFGELARME